MEQLPTATVPQSGAQDPQGLNGAQGRDAGTIRPTDLEAINDIIARQLAAHTEAVAKAAADRAVRDTQRFVDQRFSRIDPALQSISRLQADVAGIVGHFQKAEEADLDPDERRNREHQRELQQEREKVAQWQDYNRKQTAIGTARQALAENGISSEDPRLADFAGPQSGFEQNPEWWATNFVLRVSQLARQDWEARSRQQQETTSTAQRRREQQIEEAVRVDATNERRLAARGRIETQVPNGGAQASSAEALRDLYTRDKKAWAKAVQRDAKKIVRGDITDPAQLLAGQ